MTPEDKAVCALMDAMRSSIGASPALKIFAWPKYPYRELRPTVNPDGSVRLVLSKWGWEYKHRGPRPKTSPTANTAVIHRILNAALIGFTITNITDEGRSITITLREVKSC